MTTILLILGSIIIITLIIEFTWITITGRKRRLKRWDSYSIVPSMKEDCLNLILENIKFLEYLGNKGEYSKFIIPNSNYTILIKYKKIILYYKEDKLRTMSMEDLFISEAYERKLRKILNWYKEKIKE